MPSLRHDSCSGQPPNFPIWCGVSAAPQREGKPVRSSRMAAKLLMGIALMCGWGVSFPLVAQDLVSAQARKSVATPSNELLRSGNLTSFRNFSNSNTLLMPAIGPGYIPQHLQSWSPGEKFAWSESPSTIERMESAFYCNDTPFVDQVRFPLATFWNGRVKLIGFESDVTTANFVLGLPGQGSLHSLSAFGNAFLATHTPPSDQLAGINMIFSLRPRDTDAGENSGRHSIEYLVRASRGFLPFLSTRSDSGASPAR